jgi:hypothetical protein
VQSSQVVDVNETDEGARYFEGWRWWALAEIRGYEGALGPQRLADLLEPVLEGILPSAPVFTSE